MNNTSIKTDNLVKFLIDLIDLPPLPISYCFINRLEWDFRALSLLRSLKPELPSWTLLNPTLEKYKI